MTRLHCNRLLNIPLPLPLANNKINDISFLSKVKMGKIVFSQPLRGEGGKESQVRSITVYSRRSLRVDLLTIIPT